VDDAGGVSRGQGVGERDREAQRLGGRQRPAPQPLCERLAGHELHDDEVDSLSRLDLVNGDDVGVVEGGGGAGLLDEAGAAVRVGEAIGGQDLDRDLAAEAGVAGAVDLAHAPGAEGGEHLVRPEFRPGSEAHAAQRKFSIIRRSEASVLRPHRTVRPSGEALTPATHAPSMVATGRSWPVAASQSRRTR